MKHTASLDGWRGMAILLVLLGHFTQLPGINLGRFGVEVFFVLSGRLMAEILFLNATPLARFFPRRFSRVYPVLALFVLTMMAFGGHFDVAPNLYQALAALTLTANYLAPLTGRNELLDHIWSLCVEEHIYLLLGLLAWLHRRTALPLMPVLLALTLAGMANGMAQTIAGGDYYAVYWRTDVRGASILAGAVVFLAIAPYRERLDGLGWLFPALLLGAIGLNANPVPDYVKYSAGTTLLALGLVLLEHTPALVRKLFEQRFAVSLGAWSYSLYLWQQPFAKLAWDGPFKFALVLPALLLALASFYMLERPARVWLNAWLDRRLNFASKAV